MKEVCRGVESMVVVGVKEGRRRKEGERKESGHG
jgi:hypothetical protein